MTDELGQVFQDTIPIHYIVSCCESYMIQLITRAIGRKMHWGEEKVLTDSTPPPQP